MFSASSFRNRIFNLIVKLLFMKLSEFIALPEDHKRSTVMTEGVAIAKRCLNNQMIFLYQLHGFYVETYCCYKCKEIGEYRVFQDTKQLIPYLDAIQIDHLLN
ncbi:hypothetical protein DC498_18285 [Terrimonas sp.]|nr:hypothetical protein DC498_18285 [Terrimonas sp.]